MKIIEADLTHPRVTDLLRLHAETARAETARGSAHALDLSNLHAPDIQVWALWDDARVVGVGALRRLDGAVGEIKSMHTAQDMRGRGVGSMMLEHLVARGRKARLSRLSLETGSWDYFEPARRLYSRFGFSNCGPFADYAPDDNSVFMTLELEAAR